MKFLGGIGLGTRNNWSDFRSNPNLVCLFVCFVCLLFSRITKKVMDGLCWNFEEGLTSGLEKNWLDFWSNPGLVCLFVCFVCLLVSRITRNVMDRFSQNLLEGLALGLGTNVYILGVIRIWFVASAKDIMFLLWFVFCLLVCLSVSRITQKLIVDSHEIFWRVWPRVWGQLIRFWDQFGIAFGSRNFLKAWWRLHSQSATHMLTSFPK